MPVNTGVSGRFPVAEKQVLQYNVNPITEPLDVCFGGRIRLADKIVILMIMVLA